MKEGFDREMDSLLRRRARGTAESRLWGDVWGDGPAGAHLDADELGAFAEGALPAPARLAAASHLADCDRCRGVVVGLASAAAAGGEVKQHAVAATPSAEAERTPAWRALIMSLFAPRVMRFAVPVLALSLVGVVSYVALRSDKGAGVQMARRDSARTGITGEPPNAAAAPAAADANANLSGYLDQNANAASTGTAASNAPPVSRGGHGGTVEQPAAADAAGVGGSPAPAPAPPPAAVAETVVVEGQPEMTKSGPKPVVNEEEEGARGEDRAKVDSSRDKSARAPEPVDEIASGDLAAQQRASRSRANEVQMPDGGAPRNAQKRADNNASGIGFGGGASATPKESRSEPSGRARASKRAEKKAGEDDEAVSAGETRPAAGHRFRREGNAWVDVNYRPSMRSTGVRRGTEGFRALVADVPEVGRVAAALDGEVIVVVGGRAYHIR